MDLIVSPRVADQPVPSIPAMLSRCAWCSESIWLGLRISGDLPLATVVCRPCAEGLKADEIQWVGPEERQRYLAVRDSDA